MFKLALKDSVMIFIYLIVSLMLGFGIELIGNGALTVVLGLVNVGFFVMVLAVYYYTMGKQEMKIKHTNNIARKYFLETGNYRELKVEKEYTILKPIIMALFSALPLIICIIIYGIMDLTGALANVPVDQFLTADTVILIVYRLVMTVVRGFYSTASVYWALLYIPLVCGSVILPYYLGGRKILANLDQIKETNRAIYGDKKWE